MKSAAKSEIGARYVPPALLLCALELIGKAGAARVRAAGNVRRRVTVMAIKGLVFNRYAEG